MLWKIFATCMYTVVWGQCMQAQRTNPMGHREAIYRDKVYIQRTNRMGLGGHNACAKEQSYRDTRYLCVQRTNPTGIGCTNRGPTRCIYSQPILWDAACSYTYLCTYVHVRVLCHVGRTIYMGNPASLHKEELL